MDKQTFIARVKQIMNETSTNDFGSVFLGSDTTRIEDQITSCYLDAWKYCADRLPRWWFNNATFNDATIVADLVHGTGLVVIPDDYYLLTSFKMKGWQKSVMEFAPATSFNYSVQNNIFTRGNVIRPFVILDTAMVGTEQKKIARYYSLPFPIDAHEIEEAMYLPTPTDIDTLADTDTLDFNDKAQEAVCYDCAKEVFVRLGNNDNAKAIEEAMKEIIIELK